MIEEVTSIAAGTECWVRFFARTSEHAGETESLQVFVYSSVTTQLDGSKEQFFTYPSSASENVLRLSEFANSGVSLTVNSAPTALVPEDTSLSSNFSEEELQDPFTSEVFFLNNLDNEIWPNRQGAPSVLKVNFLTEFEIPESFSERFLDNSEQFVETGTSTNDQSIMIIYLSAERPAPTPAGLGFTTGEGRSVDCKGMFGISGKAADSEPKCGIMYSKYDRISGALTGGNLSTNQEIIYVTDYGPIAKDSFVQLWLCGFQNYDSNVKIQIDFYVRRKNIFHHFLQSEQNIKVQKWSELDTSLPTCTPSSHNPHLFANFRLAAPRAGLLSGKLLPELPGQLFFIPRPPAVDHDRGVPSDVLRPGLDLRPQLPDFPPGSVPQKGSNHFAATAVLLDRLLLLLVK